MTDHKFKTLDMASKFLEAATKQNEILKFQIGTFIESIMNVRACLSNYEAIKTNITEAFILSSQITGLIEDSKKIIQPPKFEGFTRLKLGLKPEEQTNQISQFQSKNDKLEDFQTQSKLQTEKHKTDKIQLEKGEEIEGVKKVFEQESSKMDNRIENWSTMEESTCLHMLNSEQITGPALDSFRKYNSDTENTINASQFINPNKLETSFNVDLNFIKSNGRPIEKNEPKKCDVSNFLENYCSTFLTSTSPNVIVNQPFSGLKESQTPIISDKRTISQFYFPIGSVKDEEKEGEDLSENDENSSCRKIRKRGRGNYKICPVEMKEEAIRITKTASLKQAADILKIPPKNIKRWIRHGIERKKGAGRKTMDPEMEDGLLQWIADEYFKTNQFPDCRDLKNKARYFTSFGHFKASKGWCDKFMKRNVFYFEKLKSEKEQREKSALKTV